MARIKESSVAEVKAAADIVEVVSARTSLRRASGARFTGRCPFHEERTPSFSVDPVEKLYYCFGCGKGGDVVRFVRETENLDFVDVDRVARRPLPRARSSTRRRRPDRTPRAAAVSDCTSLLEQATTYFERVLWESGRRRARA